jgi:hypothetical protein
MTMSIAGHGLPASVPGGAAGAALSSYGVVLGWGVPAGQLGAQMRRPNAW